MAAKASASAAAAAEDRVLIPIIAKNGKMGITLAGSESGWAEVTSIKPSSQLVDKVILGDYLDRVNCTEVKGWKVSAISGLLNELNEKNIPITFFFFREKQAAEAAGVPAMLKRANGPELITPPTKRLKQAPVASLPNASATTAPSPAEDKTPPRLSPLALETCMANENLKSNCRSRLYVKEALVRAYELHKASVTIKDLLENDDNVKANPYLVENFTASCQSMKKESDDILNIPEDLFVSWELNFMHLIKYMIETGETSVSKCNGSNHDKLNKWIETERTKRNRLERGEGKGKRVEENKPILDRIGFVWKGRKTKTFDDYFKELRAYRQVHGDVKVPRLLPDSNLGEWVSRMRKEYDDFNAGKKVAALNPERIAALERLGMIWKIRHGRPRKGDARFRLRRKSDAKNESENSATENQGAAEANAGESTGQEQGEGYMASTYPREDAAALDSSATRGPGPERHDHVLEARIQGTAYL